MKIKTSELVGKQLDWAVATCEGYTNLRKNPHRFDDDDDLIMTPPREAYGPVTLSEIAYSGDWSIGGPILHREKIAIETEHGDLWRARFGRARITFDGRAHHYHHVEGPTPLIAAMRCFVASKLGDEVDIPEELL